MKNVFVAVAGGAVAALVVWALARKSLDDSLERGGAELRAKLASGGGDLEARLRAARVDLRNQLKAQINEQVPPEVERTLRTTLASYGVTPTTGRRLDAALAAAERAGLL